MTKNSGTGNQLAMGYELFRKFTQSQRQGSVLTRQLLSAGTEEMPTTITTPTHITACVCNLQQQLS